MTSFCNLCKEKVYRKIVAKGFHLIKDAKGLDHIAYFEFIVVLLSWRKRI